MFQALSAAIVSFFNALTLFFRSAENIGSALEKGTKTIEIKADDLLAREIVIRDENQRLATEQVQINQLKRAKRLELERLEIERTTDADSLVTNNEVTA